MYSSEKYSHTWICLIFISLLIVTYLAVSQSGDWLPDRFFKFFSLSSGKCQNSTFNTELDRQNKTVNKW
jgi:hypothetical protein